MEAHLRSVGVEQDPVACEIVHKRAPGRLIHQGDFFEWASNTRERFECAAGNPPFIRYQNFKGRTREAALRHCRRHGASLSSLTSSWAPFLIATATLLKKGGRMAFVVPAEIGHAQYAAPVLDFMTSNFEHVQVVAVWEKLFPELSEDCWLLYAEGYGGISDKIHLTALERFEYRMEPPKLSRPITLTDWRQWGERLRPFLLPGAARDMYSSVALEPGSFRLGDVARVGIGYVTGANDFFHLRPSAASELRIPRRNLLPAVRSGKSLAGGKIDGTRVREWIANDEPMLLLRVAPDEGVPGAIRRYLDSDLGLVARKAYKCRNRSPWYAVPDVTVPDGFLSYMSGLSPSIASNQAGCVGTNSVHVIHLQSHAPTKHGRVTMGEIQRLWKDSFTQLSCEIEGHPLGGGMLKLEPREAARVLLGRPRVSGKLDRCITEDALAAIRQWRHYAE